jgi:peptide/nickel transport system permease protein
VITFLLRRVLQSIFVVVGVSALVFGLTFLGGDPAVVLLRGDSNLGARDIEKFRREMGFDRPIQEQYLRYLGRVIRGDLGNSLWQHRPAVGLVLNRVPATLELAGAALMVSVLVGVTVGIVAAVTRGSAFDSLATMAAVAGNSIPVFWLGIVLILTVSVWLRLLPAAGRGGLERLILPALTLGAYSGAIIARLLRSSLIEVLSKDYVRTARAKGMRERAVIHRHALKNAALPVVTVFGLQVGTLLAGAIITETVFAWPGMGLLAIQAVRDRDIPVVQAFVMMAALIVLAANLCVDFVYGYLDPRIRYS